MEALLLAFLGFLLLFPCVQLHRNGSSQMLRLSLALSLPFVIAVLFYLPELYSFVSPGSEFPNPAGLELSRAYLWTFASVTIAIYYACVVIQYALGKGAATQDRWAVLESRLDSYLAAGDIEGALGLYDNALRKDPTDFRGHYKFARLLYRTGYVKRSGEHFLLALENAPAEAKSELAHEAEKVLRAEKSNEPVLEHFRRHAVRFLGK